MTDSPVTLDTDLSTIDFGDFPDALNLIKDETVVGTFDRLELSPIEYDFGNGPTKPYIAIFTNCFGRRLSDRDTGEIERLNPTAEYALWLIHSMAHNTLAEIKPLSGERIALRYNGKALKKDVAKAVKQDPNTKVRDTDEYHSYSFVALDRERATPKNISWDTVEKMGPKN